MTRLRTFLVVVTLGIVLFALWYALTSDDRRASSSDEASVHARQRTDSYGGAFRRGGVSAREVDPASVEPVRGQIVDEDGMPIDAGRVSLQCLQGDEVSRIPRGVVRVGPEGVFEGPGCRGEVCVSLTHPHLVPAEPWVVRPGRDERLQARGLERLFLRVEDPRGVPVEAARVTFVAPRGDGADPTAVLPLMTTETTSDAEGLVSVAWIERPPCDPCEAVRNDCERPMLPVHDSFDIAVRAAGWGPLTVRVSRDELETSLDDPLVLRMPTSADVLSGRLVDGEGRPYPRAFVLLRSEERRSEQHRAEAAAGDFEFASLGPGTYTIRAIVDGVELVRRGGLVAGDDVELVGSKPADGLDVIVLVTSPDGDPREGVEVRGGPFAGERTDMKGEVRVRDTLAGRYSLRLRSPGQRTQVERIEVPPASEVEGSVFRVELRLSDLQADAPEADRAARKAEHKAE